MLKYVFLACLLGLAGAGVIIQQQHQQEDEHLSYPKYKFHYSVHDEHTKDIKEQEESRDGDRVEGKYSLLQPDGYKRIVEYTADKHSGFNAVVRNEKDHREIQHEIQHEIENQSKHEIKIEHQHSGVYGLGSFAAGENHGFGKNEFSAGETSKIDFGKLEENKLESQHKFTAEELGKYGFSQFISSGGGSEVHKFDSKESSNQELKLQHPHGHSQIKFEIQHHEPKAKELISELHQFPKYESNIQHFHDQSDSEIKLEHYEPNRQIKFEHEINHQEPKLEGINWEQQGFKQEPKYEIKYEFKDEPKHEIKYEIKHELGLELSKPDGIKWEQQELNHKQQEEIKYEGVRWEQIFKQQPKLEELEWENRGLKQESKLGEIKWSYQPNYEAHIREDKRQEEANVVGHEINIKHIEPIKHEEYEQHAEQHHSFGHSEIKLQLHHRPTVQQEYKFESQKQPETSHVEESQTESPSFREEELKKLAESYSGGESEESSAGEASGYKYDKPAVKFELPSKQDW